MSEGFFEFRERLTIRRQVAPPAAVGERKPMTVSQLTRQIDQVLKKNLPQSVVVTGEVSNFNAHAGSGHLYFTLKDPDACIDCVMFRSDAARVKFTPKDGMELLAGGRVGVYAQRGRYQLYVNRLDPVGQGALELAFQQLRAKLEREGLFAHERKKPLPAFPLRIVIITAAQAAALHDVLKVLRRFPWITTFLYPVTVQGDGAAPRIVDALRHLTCRHADIGGVDLIILARGGGSLEDLWAFNDEAVARAIAASTIPVVTGIGHEVDTSIADLVADHHAHTPTEAAQVATSNWRGVAQAIDAIDVRLGRMVRDQFNRDQQMLDAIARHEFFRRPLDRINSLRQLLDDRQRGLLIAMNSRLRNLERNLREVEEALAAHSPSITIAKLTQHVTAQEQRLRYAVAVQAHRRVAQLDAMERELRALSPDAVLRRGFSMTMRKKDGIIIRSAATVKEGDRLLTRFADGSVESIAQDKQQLPLFKE